MNKYLPKFCLVHSNWLKGTLIQILGALSLHNSILSDTMIFELQPPRPPWALPSVSFTQFYFRYKLCFPFKHQHTERASGKTAGIITGLISFVYLLLGVMVHATCCPIFGHRYVSCYAWFWKCLWENGKSGPNYFTIIRNRNLPGIMNQLHSPSDNVYIIVTISFAYRNGSLCKQMIK